MHDPVASKNSIGSDSQPIGMNSKSSEFVVYHRIIGEIDYHGMEAVLKPADEGVEVPVVSENSITLETQVFAGLFVER